MKEKRQGGFSVQLQSSESFGAASPKRVESPPARFHRNRTSDQVSISHSPLRPQQLYKMLIRDQWCLVQAVTPSCSALPRSALEKAEAHPAHPFLPSHSHSPFTPLSHLSSLSSRCLIPCCKNVSPFLPPSAPPVLFPLPPLPPTTILLVPAHGHTTALITNSHCSNHRDFITLS